MGSSHHDSDDHTEETRDAMRKTFKRREDSMTPELKQLFKQKLLGAQKDHPEGMYGPEDEGSLSFAVAGDAKNQRVRVEFGSQVRWLAMTPDQAIHFANILLKAADEVK